jgi:hypothetical protein
MAEPTRQQLMDALLAGTFDKLDTAPKVQPGYTMEQIYGGILPPALGSPYMTPEERALLQKQVTEGRAVAASPTPAPWFVTPSWPQAQASPMGDQIIAAEQAAAIADSRRREQQALADYNARKAAGTFGDIGATPKARQGGLMGLMAKLFGGGDSAGNLPRMTPAQRYEQANIMAAQNAMNAKRTGTTGAGYTYLNGRNIGYSAAEQAKRAAQGQAQGNAIRRSAQPTYSASGDDMSFQPTSVQNSTRWQTGY